MCAEYTYPGVYLAEDTGGVHPIEGVSTSVTVFVGWAARGPVDRAQALSSFTDFERTIGGLDGRSFLGYAVRHFFENGGNKAHVLRLVADNATTAAVEIDGKLLISADSPGNWGNDLAIEVILRPGNPDRFGIGVFVVSAGGPPVRIEQFNDLTIGAGSKNPVDAEINAKSNLIKVSYIGAPASPPTATRPNSPIALNGGNDGALLVPNTHSFDRFFPADGAGGAFRILDKLDSVNLLIVPGETTPAVVAALQAYCYKRRAFCILDSIETATLAEMRAGPGIAITGPGAMNSALYYPWVLAPDPLQNGALRRFPPSGFLAGIYARTDVRRGVWKAPANEDVSGAAGVALALNDAGIAELNLQGINCIRQFDSRILVWGSRTLHGGERFSTEWKYVPIRRTVLFIEESIYRGMGWAVFEPNGEPLWANIRRSIENFMYSLWQQGAFPGGTPQEAYFVKCDNETTTLNDFIQGVVNIHVGFATLKPGEFMVIIFQQKTG